MPASELASSAGAVLMRLVNARTGATVASVVEVAATRVDRRRGLLGRGALDLSAALILAPCAAVHTVFMRFPIDVIFVDRKLRVKRIYHRLAPYRLTSLVWSAQSVLELPSGCLADSNTSVGDELQISPREESSE